jgi:hypothetical protein
MMYWFLSLACIMGPLGAWYAVSADERHARFLRGLLSILVIGILFLSLWLSRSWMARMEHVFLRWANADEMFPSATQGAVDEVRIGSRNFVSPLPLVMQAGPGERLQVRGWIRSCDSFVNPIKVCLVAKRSPSMEMPLISTNQERPDIVRFFTDPLLGMSGFLAEVTLPADFQNGLYSISVEVRGASWKRFYSLNAIEGVTPEASVALENAEKAKRVIVSGSKANAAAKASPVEQGRKKRKPRQS